MFDQVMADPYSWPFDGSFSAGDTAPHKVANRPSPAKISKALTGMARAGRVLEK